MTENQGKKPGATEMLDYLFREAASLLIRQGESQTEAEKQAKSFAMRVLKRIGGGQLYIPKETSKKAAVNQAELRTKFNKTGEQVPDFARNNGISSVWAYHILKATKYGTGLQNSSNQFLSDITIEAARMLVTTGVPINEAAAMAADFISVSFGKYRGLTLYFPSVKQYQARERASDIWKQYQTGHKVDEIAGRYGLSVQAVYLIIRERCQETGGIPPGKSRKGHPLLLVRRRILQVAEDYRTRDQPAFNKLQKIAGQIDSVRQSLQQKGSYDADTRTTEDM